MNTKGLTLISENMMLVKQADDLMFKTRMLEDDLERAQSSREKACPGEVARLKSEKQILQDSLELILKEKSRVTLEIKDVRKKLKELRLQIMREDEIVQDVMNQFGLDPQTLKKRGRDGARPLTRQSGARDAPAETHEQGGAEDDTVGDERVTKSDAMQVHKHGNDSGEQASSNRNSEIDENEMRAEENRAEHEACAVEKSSQENNILFESFRKNLETQNSGNSMNQEHLMFDFDQEFENLLANIKEKRERIRKLMAELEQSEREKKRQKQRIAELEATAQKHREQLGERDEKLRVLEEDLLELETRNERLGEDKEEAEGRLDGLEMTARQMTFERKKLDFAIRESESKLQRKAADFESLLQKQEKAKEDHREQLQKQQARLDEALTRLSQSAAEMQRRVSAQKVTERENEGLRRNLKYKEHAVRRLEEEASEAERDLYMERVKAKAVETWLATEVERQAEQRWQLEIEREKLRSDVRRSKQKMLEKARIRRVLKTQVSQQKEQIFDLLAKVQALETERKILELSKRQLSSKSSYLGKKVRKTRLKKLERVLFGCQDRFSVIKCKIENLEFGVAKKVDLLGERLRNCCQKLAEIDHLKNGRLVRRLALRMAGNWDPKKWLREESRSLKSEESRILRDFTKGEVDLDSESLYYDFNLFFEEKMLEKMQNLEHESVSQKIRKLEFKEKVAILGVEKDYLLNDIEKLKEKIGNLKVQYSGMKTKLNNMKKNSQDLEKSILEKSKINSKSTKEAK